MLNIIHHPFGQEHPYEQGAEERSPRLPLAGEPFTVGIVTRPAGAATAVKVHFQLNDAPAQTIDAIYQVDWQARQEEGVGADMLDRLVRVEQDVWQAQLTAPPAHQKLTYWLEADEVVSQPYTLCGEAWQTVPTNFQVEKIESGMWQMALAPNGADSQLGNSLPTLQKIEHLSDGSTIRRIRLTFAATPEEAFFGFGERYNALNQRGEILDIRCFEQYKTQGKRTYMPIPFLLSSQKYGVWVESNRWMQFDLTQPDTWILEADCLPDGSLNLTWFTADDPFEIVGKFCLRTGQPALPPEWAFGLWMSGNEWNSQARVLHEVEQTLKHDIPASVLVIEAWSDETTFYIWNDAEYNAVPGDQTLRHADFTYKGKWTDPKGMVDFLHAKGIKVLLWQIPTFKAIDESHPQHDADKAFFEAEKFGVRENDGLYKVRPFWFRNGYLLDVTNRAALDWWLEKRAYLLEEIGIDGFKTDGGEHLWGLDTHFADGRTGAELWNEYPLLYTETYYQFATAKKQGDALIFSRAGFTGSQKAPAHWAGDENSTWEAFRSSILAGLSAGISGIPFWGWDLGGFSGEIPTAELYLRGAAMAAFCPIMQYHAEYNHHRQPNRDRTPWNMQERTGDERVIPIFRELVKTRQKLMPYILGEAKYSAETGQPMMRALQVTDPAASPYQYYFGRDLLICPVVEAGATTWTVHLPAGNWRDFWTQETIQGGREITVSAPLARIPVFIQAGAKW